LSPLTKLFVVLLVLTSMLTTAGFIVFVNGVRPLQPQLDAANVALADARSKANTDLAAIQLAQEQFRQEIAAHHSDRANDAGNLAKVQGQVNDAKSQMAQLEAEKTNLQAAVNTLNSNLSLITATVNKLQEQVTALRSANDTLVRRSEDDGRRLSDLSSQTETMGAALSQTKEQLQAELEKNQKLGGWIKDHAGNPDEIAAGGAAGAAVGAPAISGHVVEKNTFNGNTYVTISVGSADGVAKGMQFYVLDRPSGQFLGIITIDSVDSNNSIGRLEGEPAKVAQVRAGNDVKTQLRGS